MSNVAWEYEMQLNILTVCEHTLYAFILHFYVSNMCTCLFKLVSVIYRSLLINPTWETEKYVHYNFFLCHFAFIRQRERDRI